MLLPQDFRFFTVPHRLEQMRETDFLRQPFASLPPDSRRPLCRSFLRLLRSFDNPNSEGERSVALAENASATSAESTRRLCADTDRRRQTTSNRIASTD